MSDGPVLDTHAWIWWINQDPRPGASEWFEAAAHPPSVEIVPVTPAIAAEVAALPGTFHRDPADRLIVATCRVLGAPLVTHDLSITRSSLVTRWRPGR